MRFVRALPSRLRVLWAIGLLLSAMAFLLLSLVMIAKSRSFPLGLLDFLRVVNIGIDLSFLAQVCFFAVNTYGAPYRHPGSGRFRVSSWRKQVWTTALLASPSLSALVMTLVVWSDSTMMAVAIINVIAALVVAAASVWTSVMTAKSRSSLAP